MKLEEKTKKKDEQGLIIKKYQQYLKLEKSLSKNTLEAYLTDLEKLLSFLSAEGVEILEVSLTDLQRFAARFRCPSFLLRSIVEIIRSISSTVSTSGSLNPILGPSSNSLGSASI